MINDTNQINKQPLSSTKIRFQDCDPYGHLNNSEYLTYMMNAREDHIYKYYDFDLFKFALDENKAWVISKNEIVYKYPTFVMEKVNLRSQLLEYTNKSFKIEICMFDEKMEKVKALLWTNFIFFDLKLNKVIRHSEDLMNLFESAVLPIESSSIEERLRTIKS